MTIFNISNDLSECITSKVNNILHLQQSEIDTFIKNDTDFVNILNYTEKLIEENLFVVIKNIGFNGERSVFESFVKLFGLFYGAVEYTNIKMDCLYTGCKYGKIEFHNDDAIDLVNQPKIGLIQVITEDPMKTTDNGIVKIDDVVKYLKSTDRIFLEDLFTIKIPMLSFGINYDGINKDKIIVKEPILYRDGDNINVRFDLTRINYYYWKEGLEQSYEESKFIYKFLSIISKFRRRYYLEKGDILIHQNKRTLHDRTECNFSLNQDGSLNTREIFVSFAKE